MSSHDQFELQPTQTDILIIGAGIAGASLAAMLSEHRNVTVLEMENRPGYHTTGRSAAIYTEIYGNAVIRALTSASRSFFECPPDGFAQTPLWQDIDTFLVGTEKQKDHVDALYETVKHNAGASLVKGAEYERLVSLIKPGVIHSAVRDGGSKILDVAAIHQGFLRLLKANGGQLFADAEVKTLARDNAMWTVDTAAGRWQAPIIVNAGGAWADHLATLAGVSPLGLQPKRRTVCVVDIPPPAKVENWPMTVDVEEQYYFKPENGQLLCSPADETPSQPCDAQPEEIDMAIAIDRIQRVLNLEVRKFESKWAGLRTFAADKTPVVGFDPVVPGFFWLAGQGGYGIQTAPAMAQLAAALVLGKPVPETVTERGVSAHQLSPDRFATAS